MGQHEVSMHDSTETERKLLRSFSVEALQAGRNSSARPGSLV